MFFRKRLKKYDPEAEKTLRNDIEANGGLEKGDLPAMIISAMLVIFPIALIALALFVILILLFM